MSGGVDSSVVAAMLAAEGYDVVGVTLQLYDHGAALARKGACCAGRDIHDARRVAETIGFPHYVLDYESRFRESVIDEFADAYLAGATPVPCIRCNERVKFRDLLGERRTSTPTAWRPATMSAASRATGRSCTAPRTAPRPELFPVLDDEGAARLPALSARRAARRTRPGRSRRATGSGWPTSPTARTSASCRTASSRGDRGAEAGRGRAGDIVHLDGRVLGGHQGILRYTVGQRRGLGVGGGEPLFVVRLDAGGAARSRRAARGAGPAQRPGGAR